MLDYIAFVNRISDAELAAKHYLDAAGVRVPLRYATELLALLPQDTKAWIDAGIDSISHQDELSPGYSEHIKGFRHGRELLLKGLAGTCPEPLVRSFVEDTLDKCADAGASWISIPQVPFDTSRTAAKQVLNRQLSAAAGTWVSPQSQTCKLMLPVILTKTGAFDSKTKWRNEILKHVEWVEKNGRFDGVWVANAALGEELGSGTSQSKRFPGLIALHEELRSKLPDGTCIVAGPYWAMNLILWARGLVTNPAIGVAGGFSYFVPGSKHGSRSADRIALPPLLRRAKVSNELAAWLQASSKLLSQQLPSAGALGGVGNSISSASTELGALARHFRRFDARNAREQVALFYRGWLSRLHQVQPSVRPLALRQEFSDAHVIGALLKDLPRAEDVSDPGRLAQQFMLSCL